MTLALLARSMAQCSTRCNRNRRIKLNRLVQENRLETRLRRRGLPRGSVQVAHGPKSKAIRVTGAKEGGKRRAGKE
jgi:hypothetical protein